MPSLRRTEGIGPDPNNQMLVERMVIDPVVTLRVV